jgi:glycosyltransferase involved in cell wall biosynthesis
MPIEPPWRLRARPDMPRVLVITIVHHPSDARIRHREIQALLDAGWRVTYAAPFSGYGAPLPSGPSRLSVADLPRATGWRRLHALRAARRLLASRSSDHDVVILHDPELLLALPGIELPVVWDVHEDTPAALTLKPWLPAFLRRPAAAVVRTVERLAARRVHVILAEESYRARFGSQSLVIPNTVKVPDQVATPADRRVVYLGHVTLARGAAELVAVGKAVAEATGGTTRLLILGAADDHARQLLEASVAAGEVDWPGFVPSDEALPLLNGALAGLCLLHDEANYRASMPTKVVEYMAHGVPVITTPLPLARDLVQRAGAGVVVPFNDPGAVVAEILRLREEPLRRTGLGAAGHRVAAEEFDWRHFADRFVAELARVSAQPGGRPKSDRAAGRDSTRRTRRTRSGSSKTGC